MQIVSRVDGSYYVPYQNNGRVIQEIKQVDVASVEEENESIQIGARSFSDKEWNDFFKKFDSVQNAVRELMKERHEKLEKEKLNREKLDKEKLKEIQDEKNLKEKTILEDASYSYPTENSDGEVRVHITQYIEKGTICRNAGKIEKYEWAIPFESRY